jgi:signal transduction histidine kinase
MAHQLCDGLAAKNRPHLWQKTDFSHTVEEPMPRPGLASPAAAALPLPVLRAPATDGVHVGRLAWARLGTTKFAWCMLGLFAGSACLVLAVVRGPAAAGPEAVFVLLTAIGGFGVLASSHREATELAVAEERHRIARELHDGLAQELAYIRMEAMRMATLAPDSRAGRLAKAAERALDESRGAIAALRSDSEDPFAVELSQLAGELTGREGARLTLQVDSGLELREDRRQALLRIVREAITNGLRHGHATEVALELSSHDGVRLAVRDNGAGFVPGGPRRGGSFGLTTMKERAQALGGDLRVESRPGEGTMVEVLLP